MSRFSLLIMLMLSSITATAQVGVNKVFNIIEDECYIVARGTKSKQSFIAKKFNILNDSITHIGIGMKVDSAFRVYNVNPVRNANALFIETFESFINQSDLVYLGLWKLKVGKKQKKRIREVLENYSKELIEFDFDFLVDGGKNRLYCSEFCWIITNGLGRDYKYPLRELNTKEVEMDRILKRDVLEYVPVDYFLTFEKLEKIETWSDSNFKF